MKWFKNLIRRADYRMRKQLGWPVRMHASVCGHDFVLRAGDTFEVLGEKVAVRLPQKFTPLEYCNDCWISMTIQCAWCGKPIFVDDPVTLYLPDEAHSPVASAKAYENTGAYVGCLRWDCAWAHDRAGFWEPPGQVRRVMSPMEAALHAQELVIVESASDVKEAHQLQEKTLKSVARRN